MTKEKIKKTLKIIGLSILGVMIAIGSWLLNNLFHVKRNYQTTKDNKLKNDVSESKEDIKEATENVDKEVEKLNEAKEEAKHVEETHSTTEERLDKLEQQGVIKRRPKNAK